jgi:hypothetical protein
MKMKFLGMVTALALFASCTFENAQADLVDVSFTASGSARHWLLDFSVTNHIGDDQRIYFFDVALPSLNIVSSPPNWGFAGAGNVPVIGLRNALQQSMVRTRLPWRCQHAIAVGHPAWSNTKWF